MRACCMYYGDSRGGIDIVLEYSHVSPPDPSYNPTYALCLSLNSLVL